MTDNQLNDFYHRLLTVKIVCKKLTSEILQSYTLTDPKIFQKNTCPETPEKSSEIIISNKSNNVNGNVKEIPGIKPTIYCPEAGKQSEDDASNNNEDLIVQDQRNTDYEKLDSSNEVTVWPCTDCDKKYPSQRGLEKHQKIHNANLRKWECETCYKCFKSGDNLLKHTYTHTGERPYQCKVCGKGFSQPANLSHHERIHSNIRPYICMICDTAFRQPSHLTQHLRVHTDERPYPCTVCGDKFKQLSVLQHHSRSIHGAPHKTSSLKGVKKKRFKRPFDPSSSELKIFGSDSNKIFSTRSIVSPEQVSSKPNDFGDSPSTSSPAPAETSILQHDDSSLVSTGTASLEHFNSEVQVCLPVSIKEEPIDETLHQKTVEDLIEGNTPKSKQDRLNASNNNNCNGVDTDNISESKVFISTLISECTNSKNEIVFQFTQDDVKSEIDLDMESNDTKQMISNSHENNATTKEEGSLQFNCDFCSETFTELRFLQLHQKHHLNSCNQLLKCAQCEKYFLREDQYLAHCKFHSGDDTYKCKVCQKTFSGKYHLQRHENIHERTALYTCKICNKTFTQKPNLRTHEKIHDGIRLHECDICYKKFKQKVHLKNHSLIHANIKPYHCIECGKKFRQVNNLTSHMKKSHPGL